MQEESPENKESSGINKKWLRIIIVVAIGIPVLIELSTLFNLVKVQFWGKEETPDERVQHAEPVRGVTSGDTLAVDEDFLMTVREMRIGVSPTRWDFELELRTVGIPDYAFQVFVDSVALNSGSTLTGLEESTGWQMGEGEEAESEYVEMKGEWEIPNGDIPTTLFMTVEKKITADSVSRVHKEVALGPIPARYRSDSSPNN